MLSGQLRGLTGEQYETAVIAQILVTLQNAGVRGRSSYLRTRSKLEVDLVLESEDGLIALELKNRPSVTNRDAKTIERARPILGDRYRCGIVVYRGERIEPLTDTVVAVPDWWLLGMD